MAVTDDQSRGYVSALDPAVAPGSEAAGPEDPPGGRNLRRLAVPGGAFALVVGALLVLAVTGITRAPVSTPALVGLPESVAVARVTSAQLATGAVGVAVDPRFSAGYVMAQSPRVDALVPRGTPVRLVIAAKPSLVAVPDLTLAPDSVALARLHQTLIRPVEYDQLSTTVPFGFVISQVPAPGTTVMSGSQVAIAVSEGSGSGGVPVPNLVGKKATDAQAVLESVFLVPMWIDRSVGPTRTPQGTVSGQLFAPGSRIQIGSGVPLTISAVTY